ncbi:MAG: hypothetical protein A2219_03700 [Elusimicrobia bacterium RIFOXYA2_FULL_50_26]|nr:MAG: hypothetical protein A2219_03700 [Elusimicrobia bacterium RIFOXYA2_FULL_50_26]OGS24096.1 MAG: hypothetical protein A2314_02945 [Elusimicrobia bacterium RIFOXYB2_FULL_50_12]
MKSKKFDAVSVMGRNMPEGVASNVQIIFTILVFFCMLMTGCTATTRYCVMIDAINGKQPINKKCCYIFPGFKDLPSDDLQFLEYKGHVKHGLQAKGYSVVEDVNEANIIVFLTYGIGEPKLQMYSYYVPVIGQTGYKSTHTYGSLFSFNNVTLFKAKTTNEPEYGIVGDMTHEVSYTTYDRHIIIDAYDKIALMENQNNRQLWQTKIFSTGRSGDLRSVFPALIAAAIPFISENTGKAIQIDLTEDDESVKVIIDGKDIHDQILVHIGDYYNERYSYHSAIPISDRAILFYQQALEMNPYNTFAYLGLGKIYKYKYLKSWNKNDLRKSKEYFRKAETLAR